MTGESVQWGEQAETAARQGNAEFVAGTAGASARREYERRRSGRETRIRDAHPRMGGLILAVSEEPQSTRAWATGAEGEAQLGRRLDSVVGAEVQALHDRRIRGTRANIDHIVVCPSGVLVIDAKKYRGRPTLKAEGGIIRPRVEKLMIGSRDRTNLVDGAHKQVELVRAALGAHSLGEIPVGGMLCFVEADWPLIGGDFTIAGVRVLWPRKALERIRKPGTVETETVQRVVRVLAAEFPSA